MSIARDFLSQRVFDLVRPELIDRFKEDDIWKAIAETSDDALYQFYARLVKERSEQ